MRNGGQKTAVRIRVKYIQNCKYVRVNDDQFLRQNSKIFFYFTEFTEEVAIVNIHSQLLALFWTTHVHWHNQYGILILIENIVDNQYLLQIKVDVLNYKELKIDC